MHFPIFAILSFLSFMMGIAQAAAVAGQSYVARNETGLSKRVDDASFTYYAVGLGACGETNVASDFVVALNVADYGSGYPGPHCFQTIQVTANGKTTTARIVDECPTCPEGGLDFSTGLFEYFADLSVGVLYGSWNYV